MSAFVFPGQGAQYSGMGAELCKDSEAAAEIFERAESVMSGITELCFSAPDSELIKTENAQPAIFCVSLAAAAALAEKHIVAQAVAGFSLGEITALTYAGVFGFEDGLRLVIERGRLMSLCASEHKGAMAAVLRLEDSRVEEIARSYTEVFPVNYNSDGQLAVAGNPEQLERFLEDIVQAGGRAVRLNVSGAFHCPYMNAAGDGLRDYLKDVEINAPRIPLYSNVTGLSGGNSAELIPRQVCSPVLWKQTIRNMLSDNVDGFVEVGPGNVLCGLIRKISPQTPTQKVTEVLHD